MKKILVQLIGTNIDVEDINPGFNATEWKISKESDGYYITSERFHEPFDHEEILSQVNLLLDVLNGAANIIHNDHKKIGTGGIVEINENGQRNIFPSIHERVVARDRSNAVLIRAGNIVESTPLRIVDWVKKAKTHESVRDVLHFFNEISWWNLYKVYEIIRDDVKGQKQLYSIISKAELSSFTQAAQSRDLIGDNARHASKSFTPPQKKLTLEDASNIIIKLFENWVNSK